jgi:hypothetical protein
MMSPLVTAFFLEQTSVMFRQLGKQPPSMYAMREATIFAVGISLMRSIAMM